MAVAMQADGCHIARIPETGIDLLQQVLRECPVSGLGMGWQESVLQQEAG
jgi:hypothetical protein